MITKEKIRALLDAAQRNRDAAVAWAEAQCAVEAAEKEVDATAAELCRLRDELEKEASS